MLCSLEKY